MSRNEIVTDCVNVECPSPEGHLYVNVEKSVFHCFRCGFSGTISYLKSYFKDEYGSELDLSELGSIDRRGWRDVDLSDPWSSQRGGGSSDSTELPEDVQRIAGSSGEIASRAIQYLEGRGLSLTDVARLDLGYGTGDRVGWIYIPIFARDDGRLVYYIRRRYPWMEGIDEEDVHENPYMNPPNEKVEKGKSEVVFNQSRVMSGSSVYVVEGWMDAAKMGPQAVALMGKEMSERQKGIILSFDPVSVTVCMDADERKATAQIARELSPFVDVNVIFLDEGDPGDITEAERGQVFRSKESFGFGREMDVLLSEVGS